MIRRLSLSALGILALLVATLCTSNAAFAGFDYAAWWASGGSVTTEGTAGTSASSEFTPGVTYGSLSVGVSSYSSFSGSLTGSQPDPSTTQTLSTFTGGGHCANRSIIAALFPQNLQCGNMGWVLPGFIWGDCPMVACTLKLNSTYHSPLGSTDF